MLKIKPLLVVLALSLIPIGVSDAGFVIEIQTVGLVTPGSTIGVDVYGYTDGGVQPITGFDLKFDVQGPGGTNVGNSLPTGITKNGTFLSNILLSSGPGTSENPGGSGVAARDFYINADNNNIEVSIPASPTKTRLFTMNFDVAAGLDSSNPGTYVVSFVDGGAASNVLGGAVTNFDPLNPSKINGSFTIASISAVPEPTTMGALGLALIGAGSGFRRRWARK